MLDYKYAGKLLFPRLPNAAAHKQLAENRALQPEALLLAGDVHHPSAAPAPVGGHPASAEHLRSVQAAIRGLALTYSFPSALSGRDQASFDRDCGTLIFRKFDIVAGDAASAEVWSFVSLVLAPEIPFWRFPGAAEERYLGSQRNTFQRLWWRAWTFGPDLATIANGATPFGEDDYVQVMERPTVSGNRRLAQLFHKVVVSSDLTELGMTRSELVRRLVVQVRAKRAHLAFDVMTDVELEKYILQIRNELPKLP